MIDQRCQLDSFYWKKLYITIKKKERQACRRYWHYCEMETVRDCSAITMWLSSFMGSFPGKVQNQGWIMLIMERKLVQTQPLVWYEFLTSCNSLWRLWVHHHNLTNISVAGVLNLPWRLFHCHKLYHQQQQQDMVAKIFCPLYSKLWQFWCWSLSSLMVMGASF